MTKFFLDAEFNGFNGPLLSLAMTSENGEEINIRLPDAIVDQQLELDPFVAAHVWPKRDMLPGSSLHPKDWPYAIQQYLGRVSDGSAMIYADWPDDIRYFCGAIITGPGKIAHMPVDLFFCLKFMSEDYPEHEARHNPLHDAREFKRIVMKQMS